MSLSDLQKMKLLRPESEWSGAPARSEVQSILAFLTGMLGIAGCVLMIVGDGHLLTWIGLAMFAMALGSFTWVNLKGIWSSS